MKHVNFISPFIPASSSLTRWKFYSLVLIGSLTIALLSLSFWQLSYVWPLEMEYLTLEHALSQQESEGKGKQKLLAQYKQLKKLYKSLSAKESIPYSYLISLAQTIPADTWIEEFKYSHNKKITLKGYTYSSSSLATFITALSLRIKNSKIMMRTLKHTAHNKALCYELEIIL